MDGNKNLESRVEELSIKLQEAMLSTDINDPEYLEKTIALILAYVKDILNFNCAEFFLFKNLDGSIPKRGEIGSDPRKKTDMRLHWITGVGYEKEYIDFSRGKSFDINNMPRGPPYSLFDPKFNFEPLKIYDNEADMKKLEEEKRIVSNFLKKMKKAYDEECNPADFPRGGFSEFVYQIFIPCVREIPEGKEMFGLISIDSPLDIPLDQPPSEEKMNAVLKIVKLAQAPLITASLVHQLNKKNLELEDTLKKLKEAQEIIVRTRAQAEYAKFSEQVNHQINTLLLGVIPGIEHLNESIRNYNQNFSKFFSELPSKEDREKYFNIENLVSEIAPSVKSLTGMALITAKKRAREIFSKHNLNLDNLIDKYAEMQLPDDIGEQLLDLTSRYGESVFNSIYYLFDIKHSLSTMKTSTKRIASLVSAIRDYTFGGLAQNYDLITGLESTLIVMEVKLGGVIIKKQYEGKELPKITCYPGALDQVWTNIINNAVEAGAKNILIDAYVKDNEHVAVKIENDGPQIPAEAIQKIFDKYYSTKKDQNEGTGLGLYMSKEIIEKQHSGSINVYSDPERTYFEIILPIKK